MDLLPPEVTSRQTPARADLKEPASRHPVVELPPELPSASLAPLPTTAREAIPIQLSTAPTAAGITQKRDLQAMRFLWLTIFGSLAIAAVLGAGYLLLNPQISATAVTSLSPRTMKEAAPARPRQQANGAARLPPTPARPDRARVDATPPMAIAERPPTVSTALPPPDPALTDPAPDAPAAALPSPSIALAPSPPLTASWAEIEQLVQALEAARVALGEANFAAAESSLDRAEKIAKLPKHQNAVARLREVSKLVNRFHEVIRDATQSMQAGETFKVGTSTQVTLVEAQPDRIVLRIAGMNKTYLLNELPPGLALAIADLRSPATSAAAQAAKGAYLLTHQRADRETLEKATALWQQAQAAGANMVSLMPFLTDSYPELTSDATP